MVARVGAVWLLLLVLVSAAQVGGLALGQVSSRDYVLAYEGYCDTVVIRATCLYDTRTRIIYQYSRIVGASWLPDMSQAVISDQGRVLILDRHGTALHTIASNKNYFATPQWSQDGSAILFEAADQSFTRSGFELWVSDPTGTDMWAIDHLRFPSQRPRAYWSPDGTRFVYFGSILTTTGVTEVRFCSLTEATCYQPGRASQPYASWSADGTTYVLSPGRNVIHVMDGDTGFVQEEIRAFNDEYTEQVGASTAARMVLTPTYYADDAMLFSYIPHSLSYAVGADRIPRPVETGLPVASLIRPLPQANRLLLMDQYTAGANSVHELVLAGDDYTMRQIGQVDSWTFIGVVTW